MTKICLLFSFFILGKMAIAQKQQPYHEQYRPQIHFSPKAHWMNDPNGMVYNEGVYHLFFQYYPDSTVWGPMHWGHAVSTDLIHWKEQPIALYPDSVGYIFSGSAVIDTGNTSGFGKKGVKPMVAVFTQHDPIGEKNNTDTFQTQSIAYSLNNGKTWTKYEGNPVIKNPGIRDFRDPKVMWYEEEKKWIMILTVKDHVSFYSSTNLKDWTKESDFGNNVGAHGGVWECPDFFSMNDGDKKVWVITASINPGAPNGGSGTQYFIGDFDGKNFTPFDTTTKWIDYGTDNYAGVTWSNTGSRRIFLGWMSNWNYATVVPTVKWRSANTIPRELSLNNLNGIYYLTSTPVKELSNLATTKNSFINPEPENFNAPVQSPCIVKFTMQQLKNFDCIFSNKNGEQLVMGFDKTSNNFYINRSKAGISDFNKDFAGKAVAPRFAQTDSSTITIILDDASVELFADNGLTVMTSIFFPQQPFDNFQIKSAENTEAFNVSYTKLNSIWLKQ